MVGTNKNAKIKLGSTNGAFGGNPPAAGGEIELDSGGLNLIPNSVTIAAPRTSISTSYSIKLPIDPPTSSNRILESNAAGDLSYTDNELDYLALEAANAQVNAIVLASVYGAALTGIMKIPSALSWATSALPGMLGVSAAISNPQLTGVLLIGSVLAGVTVMRSQKARSTLSKYILQPVSNLTQSISSELAPGLAELEKNYVQSFSTPGGKRFASGSIAGTTFGLNTVISLALMGKLGTTTGTTIMGALGLSSIPAAPIIGIGLAIAGILIGSALLFGAIAGLDSKGLVTKLLMNVNQRLSKIPVLGQIFSTPQDSSLFILNDTSSGPLFFGTARQAVQANISQFYMLSDDLNSAGTRNYLFGPSLNNLANSSSRQLAGLETSPININSEIVNAALLDRAKYFRQQIVGNALYIRQLEKVKNARELKDQLMYDTFEKQKTVDSVKGVEELQRKDREEVETFLSQGTEEALLVLASSLRNNVENVEVDTTKQIKKKAVVANSDIKNNTLSFNEDVIQSSYKKHFIFSKTVSVEKEEDKVEVKKQISNNNDLLLSIIGSSIGLNAYI